ncbi:MAG: DMT family transporter [Proteobacteria bacterium]|nr:DMT family transporter [Pseudomonadota bacterium]
MFDTLSPNARGMLAITIASSIFVFSDAMAKYVGQSWPVAQFLTVRGVFAVSFALMIVFAKGQGSHLKDLLSPLVLLRSALESLTAITFISALGMMPLADLTAVLMVTPLFITIIAIFLFGERVGWRRWSAIAAGFFGVLLVIQPGSSESAQPAYMTGALLGLACVACVAARDIATRKLGDHIPSVVVALGTALGSLAGGLVLNLVTPWKPFAATPFAFSALAAVLLTAGNLLLIIGCRGVDLSLVAPFRYSGVIWAIIIGFLVFGDLPDAVALLGMAIIVASGVYTLHRERVRKKEAEARLGGK